MTTQTTIPAPPAPAPPSTFTPAQWQALHDLRAHYAQDHDLFSAQERMHLCFVRWLYQTGRLAP